MNALAANIEHSRKVRFGLSRRQKPLHFQAPRFRCFLCFEIHAANASDFL